MTDSGMKYGAPGRGVMLSPQILYLSAVLCIPSPHWTVGPPRQRPRPACGSGGRTGPSGW